MIDLPHPPIVTIEAPAPARPALLAASFVPRRATCAGTPVDFVHAETPLPAITARFTQSGRPSQAAPLPVVLRFSIDAMGRTHNISREIAGAAVKPGLYVDTSDIEPSLAVSRFGAGPPRANCTVTYDAAVVPLGSAPAQVLGALAVHNRSGPHAREVTLALRPPGSTCAGESVLRPLIVVYTDPERLDLSPGLFAWTALNFDVDVQGRTRNVRTVAAAGTLTLDREAKRAIGASSFVKTPRVGCLRWYVDRSNDAVSAPARPADGALRREGTACPIPGAHLVRFRSKPFFPPAFNRRGIEGWAYLRFDVAPWGDIGNVEVVASEPAQAFGEAAKASLQGAKVKAPGVAYTGCFLPMTYKLEDNDAADDEPGADEAT